MPARTIVFLAVFTCGVVFFVATLERKRVELGHPDKAGVLFIEYVELKGKLLRREYKLPDRGVVGYRNDKYGTSADWFGGPETYEYRLFQYSLAPLLIDAKGEHDTTIVVSRTGVRVDRRANPR